MNKDADSIIMLTGLFDDAIQYHKMIMVLILLHTGKKS